MKKGDANIWWIIIGAIIALVVVIVLLVMFTGKTRLLEGGLADCTGKGGICLAEGDFIAQGCPTNSLSTSAFSCQTGEVCCIGSPKSCIDVAACGSQAEWGCTAGYCYRNP